MDLSKFRPAHWMMIAGGLGWIIFGLFVDWVKLPEGLGSDGNAFDFFLRGAVPWIIFVAVAVIAALLAGGQIKANSAPWPLILLAATGLGLLLNLLLIIAPSKDASGTNIFDVGASRGIGMWLSFLFAIISFAGAVMYFLESGGNFKDLGNRDTYRNVGRGSDNSGRNYNQGGNYGQSQGGNYGQGQGGGYQAPPPPPGGNNPPPPPPGR